MQRSDDRGARQEENAKATLWVTARLRRSCGVATLMVASTLTVACRGEEPPSRAQDEAALVHLQQVLATAWVAGDRATVEHSIAPEWTSTGPDGRTTDRSTVLAQVFETGAHKIRELTISDVNARVFGDAAVVTGRTHGVGEFEGSRYDVVIRFTDTFVRREGRWQVVVSHASLVQGSQ